MKQRENLTTEYKREYTEDIKKTVVAFANTNGGSIFIGIEDDGTVTGVDNVDAVMLKTTNAIRDAVRPDITLFTECFAEEIDGRSVIVLKIQKGTAAPYYLAGKGIRPQGVYVRQGASTVPATETTILKMIKETGGEEYEDLRSLNQELTFGEAEKEFRRADVVFGQSQMKTLGIIDSDGVYSNLALLISDQCVHTVKLAVFEGTEKTIFKDRHEFSGSLLKQLNDVYDMIDKYNRTRAEFSGLYRVDTRDYPVDAIRETLLNALVHRDYSFSESTLISIFDDRLEVVSLGGLVKGVSREDIMLGASILRNKKLANIFYRLTLIEAYGTGMPKIEKSYKTFPAKPKIEVSPNAFKITLPNRNTPFEAYAGELSENEQAVLAMLVKNKTVTRKAVENQLSISQPSAVNTLNGLIKKGLLIKRGGGKNTRYESIIKYNS